MKALRPPSLQFRLAIALVVVSAALAACRPADDGNAVDNRDAGNEAGASLPSVPRPQPPMGRAQLLMEVARAASAVAAGQDDSAAQRPLDGSRFELRIRFGCRGPAPRLRESVLGWTFDRADRTLRVRAMPTISGDDAIVGELVRQLEREPFEAVEGFWIPRPWLLDSVCPAAAAVSAAPPEPEPDAAAGNALAPAPIEYAQESQAPPPAWPRVGIAQFFSETDPRTRRRGMRPYETVETLEPGQPVGSQGFNLVLSGRLQALPGGRVIACVRRGADSPPDCIVSADFDRVWIERADSREILAQWGGG